MTTSNGSVACTSCPANSVSVSANSRGCWCIQGYYRNPLEDIHVGCTSKLNDKFPSFHPSSVPAYINFSSYQLPNELSLVTLLVHDIWPLLEMHNTLVISSISFNLPDMPVALFSLYTLSFSVPTFFSPPLASPPLC